MKKLFIHIGTHKTGSTALQSTLRANIRLLRKYDYSYITDDKAQSHNVREIASENTEELVNEKDRLCKIIQKQSSTNIVLSSERYFGNYKNSYSGINQIAYNLRFVTQPYETKIIVYFRRQDTFIESLYTQTIQDGQSWSFKEFADAIDFENFDWKQLIKPYVEHFGRDNIYIRPYEKSQLKHGIVNDFAALIGIGADSLNDAEIPQLAKTNIGLSRPALEVARLCNASLNEQERLALISLLQGSNSKKTFERYSFFSNTERKALLEIFQSSNRDLALEFLGKQNGLLFEDELFTNRNHDSQYEGLTLEEVTDVLTRAMVSYHAKSSDTIRRWGTAEKAFAHILEKLRLKNIVRKALIRLTYNVNH